ncbi:ADP-ribosylation [Canariomyces notabilis]|uniref:ADP-ribosylation n=1 Tax=Canariomyces notabilis TaxID=2074819 RepID=A0AAN6QD07_9PEZI|nr:ADP-ribosylation [Canariomyces arenarius]
MAKFSFFLLSWILCAALAADQQQAAQGTEVPDTVYRADKRSPDVIKANGGFKSWGNKQAITVIEHVRKLYIPPNRQMQDPWISTSTDPNIGEDNAIEKPCWVYTIDTTGLEDRFASVAAAWEQAKKKDPRPHEKEWAVNRFIPWQSIKEFYNMWKDEEGHLERGPVYTWETWEQEKQKEKGNEEQSSGSAGGQGPATGPSKGKEPAIGPSEGTGKKPATGPSGGKTPVSGPSKGKEPATGPSKGKEPAIGPSEGTGKTPVSGPSKGKEPAAGPSEGKKPATGPSGTKKPATGPSDAKKPATGPSGTKKPGTGGSGGTKPPWRPAGGNAASGSKPSGSKPAGKKKPTGKDNGGDDTPVARDVWERRRRATRIVPPPMRRWVSRRRNQARARGRGMNNRPVARDVWGRRRRAVYVTF